MSNNLRWLHIADFHTGKDTFGQQQMFNHILNDVQEHIRTARRPDLVFITGDLANRGLASEYDFFFNHFLSPLSNLINDENLARIFVIPGNHDVDRSKNQTAVVALQRSDFLRDTDEPHYFFDPTPQGQAERSFLNPRFQAFSEGDLSPRQEWLTLNGYYAEKLTIHNTTIGILGINTAWLCCGDNDRHRLSPGFSIVRAGLEQLDGCTLRIVLGHHPIDWFADRHSRQIEALFSQYHVIYLHGHVHTNHLEWKEGSAGAFITLQTGASYQARDDDRWTNSILWDELDLTAHAITIEPRVWSGRNQEWSTDSASLPNRYRVSGADRWQIPLPIVSRVPPTNILPSLLPPVGWTLVDKTLCTQYKDTLSRDDVVEYFNGRIPGWEEALSSAIPPRAKVDELINALNTPRKRREPQIVLLQGPGGEGKSTVLRQAVVRLVDTQPQRRILWRNDLDTTLTSEDVRQLIGVSGSWLFVSDDAEHIAHDIADIVKMLRREGRGNFQFLLCSRESDWIGAGAEALWQDYPALSLHTLNGLTLTDAIQIVEAWQQFGADGLGALYNDHFDVQHAAQEFVERASTEKRRNQDGAFLGAMLQVRYGEGLRDYVRRLLHRLEQRTLFDTTLLHVFAYIAALHARNKLILSKPILAHVLKCRPADIRRDVLEPLGREAAAIDDSSIILIRHRTIAEVAVPILEHEFKFDFTEIMAELLRAALEVWPDNRASVKITEWNYLSNNFFGAGEHELGIRLAETAVAAEKGNPFFIAKLSQLLREDGRPHESVEVCRTAAPHVERDAGFYFEWGIAEGNVGNYELDAWLCGISLSDQVEKVNLNHDRVKRSLAGLVRPFTELYKQHQSQIFIEACGAVAQLGLALQGSLGPDTLKNLHDGEDYARQFTIARVEPPVALERFQTGIAEVSQLCNIDIPISIVSGDQLTFKNLTRFLNI